MPIKKVKSFIVNKMHDRKMEKQARNIVMKQIQDSITKSTEVFIDNMIKINTCKTCGKIMGNWDEKPKKAYGICRKCEKDFKNLIENDARFEDCTIQEMVDCVETMIVLGSE